MEIESLSGLFAQPFMRHALLAGTGIALACGLASYFLVLRRQVFAGDALGHVAFTGALAALLVGTDARIGLFAACVAVAMLLAYVGRRGAADDATIGSVFAWVLGLGVLLLSTFTASSGSANGSAGVRVLFGSIFGLSSSQAITACLVGLAVVCALVMCARPLLFATTDEGVASSRGLRVRALGVLFLVIVGVVVAEASQAVGALLVLGLLAAPGGMAHRLTLNPYSGMAMSAALALAAMWVGLALSFAVPALPPSFSIMAVAGGAYALTLVRRTA
ncbi:MAG: metal ABC transporter permease [Chloroflexota bacterium]